MPPIAFGSSPLTRGKRERRPDQLIVDRLIPAHAGKTGTRAPPLPPGPAHPRSRGENRDHGTRHHQRAGSSPLTRGKLRRRAHSPYLPRLIPAHAGKTAFAGGGFAGVAAHPRSRGENVGFMGQHCRWSGSSPLTRGKHYGLHGLAERHGLIPAHAGKTAAAHGRGPGGAAHPRSRGENTSESGPERLKEGSSPLTRGKLISSQNHRR